jgi:hypothetical protein
MPRRMRPGPPAVQLPGDSAVTQPNDIAATLAERGTRYGKFTGHAAISTRLKLVIHDAVLARPERTFAADQMEAMDMIAHKLARILNGDPNYADSWVDIAGYAKLVADRLEGVSV